ncbi:sigma-54-dependent Fis family transcriptional regulator, partial [Candidatus Dependentiae bacterium]|nr:sigma-54-dependent Fis family transcriptional regulator [Candidatus Dependentiae bacterium]
YFAAENKKDIPDFSKSVIEILCSYNWPGNVRELKNIIERIVIMNDKKNITLANIPRELITKNRDEELKEYKMSLSEAKNQFEKDTILQGLKINSWNVSKTAKYLNIERSLLHKKIKKYNLKK